MNAPEGSDDKNNDKSMRMMEYLKNTAGIAQGILDHRAILPWKLVLGEVRISEMVGDTLITYLATCLDIKQLLGRTDLYDVVRPLLGYYFPMSDLESIEAGIDDTESEIIHIKTELEDYIIVAKILNYPTFLIQKLEAMHKIAPESYKEAENMRATMLDSKNRALEILGRLSHKK